MHVLPQICSVPMNMSIPIKSSTGCSPFDPHIMRCSWVVVSQVDPAWTRHPWACDPRRQWGTWTSHPPRPDAVDSRHRETWDATGTTCFFPSNWNKWIFLADNKSGTHMYKYKHKGLGGCFLLAEKDQSMCGIMLSFPFWGWKIVMIQSNASKSYSVKKNHHLFCVQKMEPVGFDSIILLYIITYPLVI